MRFSPPKLRTVLVFVNLLLLLIPVGIVGTMHLYEDELLRRTEAELLGQLAFAAAEYRNRLEAEIGKSPEEGAGFGNKCVQVCKDFAYREPVLRRSDFEILPPAAESLDAERPPSSIERRAAEGLSSQYELAAKMTFAAVHLVSIDGTVLASSMPRTVGKSLLHWDEVGRSLSGEPVSSLRSRSNTGTANRKSLSRATGYRVFVSMPVIIEGRVAGALVASRTPVDVSKAIYGERDLVLLASLISLVIVVVVGLTTAVLITGPLQTLRNQARRLASGEQDALVPLGSPGTLEIQELSNSIAKMARALSSRADYVDAFAKNVSHGFKTPLTSIRGTVELLGDHMESMSVEERGKFIQNLNTDTQRLERLVGKLLALARAGRGKQPNESCEDLGAFIREYMESGRQGIRCEFHLQPMASVPIGLDAMGAVLDNIVDNSIAHCGDGLLLRFDLVVSSGEGAVQLTVADNGSGWPEGLEDPFEPFVTTRKDSGGTGIGLSIVQTIVESHQGSVHADSGPAGGASVVIRLPMKA
jgi:signal transduction histidine kinase